MKIAKPLLLISTPIGLAGGLYEGFELAGGLAFVMVALIALIGAAMGMLVMTIRREQQAEAERLAATAAQVPDTKILERGES
jgi:predicted lipid-binding transport protein (Tim44 family)